MTQRDGTRDPHRGPTQGTHTGEGPTEDPPSEGRATQGTHTGHTQIDPYEDDTPGEDLLGSFRALL